MDVYEYHLLVPPDICRVQAAKNVMIQILSIFCANIDDKTGHHFVLLLFLGR